MTIVTIAIDDNQDITDLKQYLLNSGFKFEVDEETKPTYSDELLTMLNERYEEYVTGKVKMVSSTESKEKIARIISGEESQ